jgi:hypothetical protein
MNPMPAPSPSRFHPAWLLLFLPPVVGLLMPSEPVSLLEQILGAPTRDPALVLSLVARLGFAAVVVGLVVLGWMRPRAGRPLRILKELRLQMPGVLIAYLGPGILGWFPGGDTASYGLGCLGLGCMLIGATAMGGEFESRTMGALLIQPLSRSRVYLEKMGITLALGIGAFLNFAFTIVPNPAFRISLDEMLSVGVYVAAPLCSGAWFSLLTRSTLAGAVFSAAAPGFMALALYTSFSLLDRWTNGAVGVNPWFERSCMVAIALYVLGTPLLAWRTFTELELREGGAGGRPSTGLHPLSRPVDRILAAILPARSGTAWLIRKELRLHVLPWLMALVTVGLWLAWMIACQLVSEESRATLRDALLVCTLMGVLGSVGLIGAGAACVAEEREMGTLDWQLTQPVPLRRQWWIKLGVASLLALALSVALPVGLVRVSFNDAALRNYFQGVEWTHLAVYGAVALLVFAAGVVASSISRSTMKATAATVAIGGILTGAIALGLGWVKEALEEGVRLAPPSWLDHRGGPIDPGSATILLRLLAGIAVGGIGFGLLHVAGRNFRAGIPSPRNLILQILLIAVGPVLWLRLLGEGLIAVFQMARGG